MNMQPTKAPMMVSIAKAAQLLSAAGDQIDPSNVSRYLARHPDIRTEKRGREKLVDIIALAGHRQTNVFVADKQTDRGLFPEAKPALPVASTPSVTPVTAEDVGEPAAPDALKDINLELRKIELARKRREEDLAAGRVIADKEVLTLISTVIGTVNASLERQEPGVAQQFGREVATVIRRMRKAAMADAAGRLAELAQRHLPPTLVGSAIEAGDAREGEQQD